MKVHGNAALGPAAEIERQIGAGKGEISETRSTHRNGYRARPRATRVGEIEHPAPRRNPDLRRDRLLRHRLYRLP